MTSVVRARRGTRSTSRDLSASSASSPARSDLEGQDGDSEYGSAERSGSDLSDRESHEGQDEDRKNEDTESQAGLVKSQVVDHDEDRRNPQYIPKKGTFYEHDDRTAAGGEDDAVIEITESVASIDVSRPDRNSIGDGEEKAPTPNLPVERRKTPKTPSTDRWLHDKYNENDQTPKSSDELKSVYGYDIRGEEGPPKALRRHRYGRGPNKYTRNWEDENAYGKSIGGPPRILKAPPSVTNGKEFPALQSKNDKNRINKRRNIEKKIKVVDNKIANERNVNDKMVHDKIFTNKTSKVDKELIEKDVNEDLPRWKNKPPPKNDVRKTAIVIKNQVSQQEQMKWPESPKVNSPPKSMALISSQVHSPTLPAMVPLQENKLPPARKLNQSQVPPRMQAVTSLPPATTTAVSSAAATDAGTRGKRYSSLRQRPMPDTYQPHQQQYIAEYQQPLPKPTSQQQLTNLTSLPLQQTPPPMLQSPVQHHQPIPQLHQQTPPPTIHQSSPQLHQQTAQIHQQSPQIIQQGAPIHQQTSQIIQTPQIHQQTTQIHQPTTQLIQQTAQIHPQSAQMLQAQGTQLHQQTTQIHQQSPSIHQQTPPPALQQAQPHHQTPPPSHQSINRQQAAIPLRQVPRTHQQQIALHTMSMPQGSLVTSSNYASPQIITQNQYMQGANGAVYSHVVSQVYPPPQAYVAPQHQPIPPQSIPPQALAPQAPPPQAILPQTIPPHSYHHPAPAPAHQPYAAHQPSRSVFREPSGITYYSPQEQKGAPPPTRRPTSAIPIVPPPPRERGKQDSVPPPNDNIDRIVDNMFVHRPGRTGPGETPPRSLDVPIAKQIEEAIRLSEEKLIEEKNIMSRMDMQQQAVDIPPTVANISNVETKVSTENIANPIERSYVENYPDTEQQPPVTEPNDPPNNEPETIAIQNVVEQNEDPASDVVFAESAPTKDETIAVDEAPIVETVEIIADAAESLPADDVTIESTVAEPAADPPPATEGALE